MERSEVQRTTDEAPVVLVRVDRENWRELLSLATCDEQAGLVSTNAVTLAECAVRDDAVPLGIYVDGRPIGLLVRCETVEEYELHRFMIACPEQGKGYGLAALRRFIDAGRRQERPITVRFLHWNKRAERLYRRAGFIDTGERNEEQEKVFVWKEPG